MFCCAYSILGDFITEAIDDNACGKQFTVPSEDEDGKTVPYSSAKAIKTRNTHIYSL